MRKKRATPRIISPDIKYQDNKVQKFIHYLMREGKKSLAEKIFYGALEEITKKTQKEGIEVFRQALENLTPAVEVKSKRIGGAIRSIPTEIKPRRREYLRAKWLINSALQGNGRSMQENLMHEITAAAAGEGNAIKKKNTTHRMAESNKAFSHLKI